MEKPAGAGDNYDERERAKFLKLVRTVPVIELRTMLNEAHRKMRDGANRPSPCGYTAAQRAVFYECELIRRGERL